jgi:hypothetical protein
MGKLKVGTVSNDDKMLLLLIAGLGVGSYLFLTPAGGNIASLIERIIRILLFIVAAVVFGFITFALYRADDP